MTVNYVIYSTFFTKFSERGQKSIKAQNSNRARLGVNKRFYSQHLSVFAVSSSEII